MIMLTLYFPQISFPNDQYKTEQTEDSHDIVWQRLYLLKMFHTNWTDCDSNDIVENLCIS